MPDASTLEPVSYTHLDVYKRQWQHLKLAGISLAPIGMTIVDKHVAEEARQRWAAAEVDRIRR